MAESLITIPEYKILDLVKKCLAFIRLDYQNQTDKTKSWIVRTLQNSGLERYDSIEQAIKVFNLNENDIDDPRYLEVDMMFNMKSNSVPTIYISLPTEGTQNGGNGVGVDEGYTAPIYDDFEFDNDGNVITSGTYTKTFTRRFQSTYSIVITSDNSNEVVLIYHVLKALLIAMLQRMAIDNLQNVQLGGNDLQINSSLVPENMYIRQISLNLQYETTVPDISSNQMFLDLFAIETPVNE